MIAYIFNLGVPELVIILVIVLLLFGAGKLPQVLGQMGKGVKEFKDGMKDKDDDLLLEPSEAQATQAEVVTDAEEVKS